jgi:hypothetical protein
MPTRRQNRDQRKQRHDGDILQQQDGERTLPIGRGQLTALLQQRTCKGGGGQCEAEPRNDRRRKREAREPCARAQHSAAEKHLSQPQAQYVAFHGPEARGLQFEPDNEQKHHNAELAQREYRFGIVEKSRCGRPDNDASCQIAQHAAKPQPLKNRHSNGRRRQEDQGQQEDGMMRCIRQVR